MTQIPGQSSGSISVSKASELADAPRAVVRFGRAPDGLDWIVDVDRSHRLESLLQTVLSVFELERPEQLPDRVLQALERDVAAGLMGVHDADLDGRGAARRAYVSRRKTKHLLGPTLLSQILEPPQPPSTMMTAPEEPDRAAMTNVGALAVAEQNVELVEAVERSIDERRAKRHLVLDLDSGAAHSASVHERDRALRLPTAPFRPLVFESLASLADVEALVVASGESWAVSLDDRPGYTNTLLRAHNSPYGGALTFTVPRDSLARALVAVARDVAGLHRRDRVHADLAPGNVLLTSDGPLSFDSLDVRIGTPATAATFEWAAPEQIVGQQVDPRTDVFALGKMLTAIVGGVPFGEETTYVVPIGGGDSRRVKLLKGEGVFIDILDTDYDREWQLAWQDLLGRCTAYHREKRPSDADALADELERLLGQHALVGTLPCTGTFGQLVMLEGSPVDAATAAAGGRPGLTFARLVHD